MRRDEGKSCWQLVGTDSSSRQKSSLARHKNHYYSKSADRNHRMAWEHHPRNAPDRPCYSAVMLGDNFSCEVNEPHSSKR